jgi:drug/metabolite transporter (DMT)-like permease
MHAETGGRLPGRAIAILAIGVLSLASSAILVRFAQEGPALAIATWRTVFAVVLLAPFAIWRVRREVVRFTGRDWLLVSVGGIVLGLHFVAWIESLYHTSVASSTVLVTTSPIFLAILGFLILGERLSRRVVFAIFVGVAGSVLIGAGDAMGGNAGRGPNPLLGNSLALGASLLVSFYLLIGRVVRQKTSWLAYVFPLYTISALAIVVVALLRGEILTGYSWGFYGLCLLMAVFPQIIGHGSFNYAIRFIPAALLALLSLLEPILASTAAFVLFGEAPFWLTVAGMGVVLSGVALAVWRRPRIRHVTYPAPNAEGESSEKR